MFGDYSWISSRSHGQEMRFDLFLDQHQNQRITVIELGAGTAIPTIRYLSERLGSRKQATVVRINPREPQIASPHISIATGALDGLNGIDLALAD
jgi:hypothetical protein